MVTTGRLALLALGIAGFETTTAGGWAVLTVENPPDHLVAGASYRLEFTVRQHGARPLTGLQPSLRLRAAGAIPVVGGTTIRAAGTGTEGRYVATFTVPETERLTLTTKSNFGSSDLTLMPIPVLRAGQPIPALAAADRGRRLFVAKGCGTCHINADVPEFARENRSYKIGPELSGRRLEAGYVRQRLTDPASLPAIGTGDVRMPNLGLAPSDVDALVALLAGPKQTAERGD
jgi:hypothetical protein